MKKLHKDAQKMIENIIADNMPHQAVENALKKHRFTGKVHMVAIGKAAWTMAKTASDFLKDELVSGIVVTKYGHSQGPLNEPDEQVNVKPNHRSNIEIYESGHPVSDENTIIATQKCIELAESLKEDDELLFLISGGGSALFEKPQNGISLEDTQNVTNQLLQSGADIVEMNMVRKRFSQVKAGRFAKIAAPAKVFAIVLSDVLGDRLDSIASGPAAPDASTAEDAIKVAEKYKLELTDLQLKYLMEETPKDINNVKTVITGSVRTLCDSAAKAAADLGYKPFVLTTTMNCEASEAGRFLASVAADAKNGRSSFAAPCAIIAGGETVVNIKGSGKGGRNQEIALSSARGIAGIEGALIFSLGSDGTDGPTDAAGGIVDGSVLQRLRDCGLDIEKLLGNNDSYRALEAVNGLIITGPTGTNVNDVAVVLLS